MKKQFKDNKETRTLQLILSVVESSLGVSLNHPRGNSDITDGKKIYSKLSRELTCSSYNTIGSLIDKDHAAIINLIRRADEHLETEVNFQMKYALCLDTIPDSLKEIKSKLQRIFEKKNDILDHSKDIIQDIKTIEESIINLSI